MSQPKNSKAQRVPKPERFADQPSASDADAPVMENVVPQTLEEAQAEIQRLRLENQQYAVTQIQWQQREQQLLQALSAREQQATDTLGSISTFLEAAMQCISMATQRFMGPVGNAQTPGQSKK